jgi:hypothetical protein
MPIGTCITKCIDVSSESIFWSVSTTGYNLTRHDSLKDAINYLNYQYGKRQNTESSRSFS